MKHHQERRTHCTHRSGLPAFAAAAAIRASLLCTALMTVAPGAFAQSSATSEGGAHAQVQNYAIAPGALSDVLAQFAARSATPLVYDPALLAGRQSPGIQGRYSVRAGFDLLLRDSGYQLDEQGSGRYGLKRIATVPVSSVSTGPSVAKDGQLPVVSVSASDDAIQPPTEKTRAYTIQSTTAGSKIALSPKETPQSVSVLSRAEMDDFHLNGVNEALQHVTGVTVDQYETDRTDFTSRGFQITNIQFDGVGVPLIYQSQYGDIDMALYDRIEVLRGADGLNAETGNPSATVNLIRKRPTYQFQASGNVSYGSWDTKRVDVDLSGPLNKAGTLAGRLVAVHEDGNSYIDRYQPNKDILYGVVEANLTPSTVATVGFSYEHNRSRGAEWGGLPLLDANGNQLGYSVHASTAPGWAYFNTDEQRVFGELTQQLGARWKWKTSVAFNDISSDAKFFYPNGSLNADGSGISSYTSWWKESNRQLVLDSNASGKIDLFGRTHDIVFGANFSRSELSNPSGEGDTDGTAVSYADLFAGTFPEPIFGDATDHTHYLDVRRSLYASSRWNLSDRLNLLLGVNYTQAGSSGDASGTSYSQQSAGSAPYFGLTYDLTKQITAYASFTKIFNPQYELNINNQLLGPARGRSYEAGVKGAFFDNRLNTSVNVFRIRQTNIATDAGLNLDTGQDYYTAGNATSQGIEAEIAGQITHDWNVSAGATILRVVGDDGQSTQTFVPRKSVHVSTTYRLPYFDHKLTVGSSLRWQSATRYEEEGLGSATQGAYANVDFMMRYDVNRHFTVTGTLNNALNKKHFTTMEYNTGIYAAPLNGSVNLTWRY